MFFRWFRCGPGRSSQTVVSEYAGAAKHLHLCVRTLLLFVSGNTGLLRYWTLSNIIPLFLLAALMLVILTKSVSSGDPSCALRPCHNHIHVQIITRISSGYPLWYWWVAGYLSLHSRGLVYSILNTSIVLGWFITYYKH
ncbi:hypothetical protein QBC38DRAFT_2754 [Podospora fimiseda]|uniref:GPI mannosyltransferase 2 n=1 Tax=Podospora fimiseda TaxID=252190 RepID=A0AAN7H8L3_9PEZI|nr:hypothetical protein QBC38DRAFT_2754 [Podospora fimiseda]